MKTYQIAADDVSRIENIFTHHSPSPDQIERYEQLREEGKQLAAAIILMTPKSREQSLALTKLEEVIFFANAAIARNENE